MLVNRLLSSHLGENDISETCDNDDDNDDNRKKKLNITIIVLCFLDQEKTIELTDLELYKVICISSLYYANRKENTPLLR